MTLVEIVMVVSIIGLLAAFLVPGITMAMQYRENSGAARKLMQAVQAFEMYAADHGGEYPPDQVVPSEISVPLMDAYYFPYFKIDWWDETTALGGRWDWDVGYHGFAFSVSIWQPSKSQAQLTKFDSMVDDGDLNTGRFRKVGSQYHYIIEE